MRAGTCLVSRDITAASALLRCLALWMLCDKEKDQLSSWGQKMLSQTERGNMSKPPDWFAVLQSLSQRIKACTFSPRGLCDWKMEGRNGWQAGVSSVELSSLDLHRPPSTGRYMWICFYMWSSASVALGIQLLCLVLVPGSEGFRMFHCGQMEKEFKFKRWSMRC